MLGMVIRVMGGSYIWIYFALKLSKACRYEEVHFVYYTLKCVLLCCKSVSDVAEPQHILSACHRCCSKLLWGSMFDMLCYYSEMCHQATTLYEI